MVKKIVQIDIEKKKDAPIMVRVYRQRFDPRIVHEYTPTNASVARLKNTVDNSMSYAAQGGNFSQDCITLIVKLIYGKIN